MKKSKLKLIALLNSILMLLLVFCVPVMAEGSVNADNKIILEKDSDNYLVYYEDLCGSTFEFALSSSNSTDVNSLNFRQCAQDQDNGDNIAYVDNTNRSEFGSGTQGYIWVRDNNDQLVLEADLIDLSDSLTEEELNIVNTTSERISIDTSKLDETKTTEDGVEKTIKKGKAIIENPNASADYKYAIYVANDNTTNAGKLYELAEKLNEATSTYAKLELSKEFYDLYEQLIPTTWDNEIGDDYTVLQPDDTEDGDKYILLIKEDDVVDAHFLVSTNVVEEGTNTVDKEVTETVKLPVTFDSGSILLIALGVIVIVLIVFIVLRKKEDNKEVKEKKEDNK